MEEFLIQYLNPYIKKNPSYEKRFREKILAYIATESYLCIMVLESGFCEKRLFVYFSR